MNKPTGKLLFAYQTIATLEQKVAALEAERDQLRAEMERRESHWFSLVMNCAAELETASYCMTDTAAKRVAQSGADHYRKQVNAAPSAPKADPVKQMLLEALEFAQTFLRHEGRHADDCDIFDLDDEDRHKQCSCNLDALTSDLDAAIAAARQEGGKP